MDDAAVRRIQANPQFQELERRRGGFAWTLAVIMLVIYYGFILLVAFWPEVIAARIGGGVVTLGFPLGLGVILSAVVLTGIYVVRANGEFDRLTREIVSAGARDPRATPVRVAAGARR